MSKFGIQNGQIITYYCIIEFICINTYYVYCPNRNAEYWSVKYVSFGNVNNIEFVPAVE